MEDSSFQPPASQFNYSTEMPKKPKRFFYVIIFLIILGGFFLVRSLFFLGGQQEQLPEATPAPTEFQFPTDTPSPSISPAAKEDGPAVSQTSVPVNPVDASTGLDRSAISVEVQNGSGETGVAGKAADVLKGFGYKIASTGNADSYDYENVTIKVKSAKTNFLALLKKDLGFSYTVSSASADLSSDFTADALVIIGQ